MTEISKEKQDILDGYTFAILSVIQDYIRINMRVGRSSEEAIADVVTLLDTLAVCTFTDYKALKKIRSMLTNLRDELRNIAKEHEEKNEQEEKKNE